MLNEYMVFWRTWCNIEDIKAAGRAAYARYCKAIKNSKTDARRQLYIFTETFNRLDKKAAEPDVFGDILGAGEQCLIHNYLCDLYNKAYDKGEYDD